MKEFAKAELDLKWALSTGKYPEESIFKLFQRLGVAYQKLGKLPDAIESFDKALKALQSATKLSTDQKHSIGLELKSNLKTTKIMKIPASEENHSLKSIPQRPKLTQIHPEMPGVSSKLKLFFNQNKGRHSIASETIEPGEVIVEDEPTATIILSNFCLNHCYSCMVHVASPIPCPACASVVFCSFECLEMAKSR